MRRTLTRPSCIGLSICVQVVLMWVFVPAGLSLGQETTGAGGPNGARVSSKANELEEEQAVIQDRVRRLEDRLFELGQKLKESEPEKAERLLEGLGAMRRLLVQQNMGDIAVLLREERFAEALDLQAEALSSLRSVLTLLVEEPDHLAERAEDMKRLERIREALANLISEQQKEKEDAEATRNAGEESGEPSSRDGDLDKDNQSRKPPSLSEQSKNQRLTGGKTEKLCKTMGGKRECRPGSPAEQGECSDQPMPECSDVEKAAEHQWQAADALEEEHIKSAIKKQTEALKKLQGAKKRVENKLSQLKRDHKAALLAALETRFRAMLARQTECGKITNKLAKIGVENWRRSDQLMLVGLSQDQQWVGDQADVAADLLETDGSTQVLPEIVKQVREDALVVAVRLGASDTGTYVLALQAEIDMSLRDLIDLVVQTQSQPESQNNGGDRDEKKNGPKQEQEPPDTSPLISRLKELRLLRALQLRVNRRTQLLQAKRQMGDAESDSLQESWNQLAERQRQLADMVGSLIDGA